MNRALRLGLCALFAAALTGCTQFAGLDTAGRSPATGLAYPAIVPLDDLLAQAGAADLSPQTTLAARAAALQARANALRTQP